jgi:hypothetical protein
MLYNTPVYKHLRELYHVVMTLSSRAIQTAGSRTNAFPKQQEPSCFVVVIERAASWLTSARHMGRAL